MEYVLHARKISNDFRIPYYIYGRSAFDALFVFYSKDSVILYNYRSVS